MSYRLEVVSNPRAKSWPHVARELRRVPGAKVLQEDGLEVHVGEFPDINELWGVFELVKDWKMVSVYADGRRISADQVARLYWDERSFNRAKQRLTDSMNNTALENERRNIQRPPGGLGDIELP